MVGLAAGGGVRSVRARAGDRNGQLRKETPMDDAAHVRSPASDHDAALEREAVVWRDNQSACFGMSPTNTPQVSPKWPEPALLAARNLRLEQRRQQIPVLAK